MLPLDKLARQEYTWHKSFHAGRSRFKRQALRYWAPGRKPRARQRSMTQMFKRIMAR